MEIPVAFHTVRVKAVHGLRHMSRALKRYFLINGDVFTPTVEWGDEGIDASDIYNLFRIIDYLENPVVTPDEFEIIQTFHKLVSPDAKSYDVLKTAMEADEFSAFCEGLGALHRFVAFGNSVFCEEEQADYYFSDANSVTSDEQ